MEVPFVDLKTQNHSLKSEILPLWEEILDSAGFVGGKYVSSFEQEFRKACSTEHCVLVNSGTDALRFAFISLGLKPGDEVITVPNTFIATTEAISQAGGKIVFVDIDRNTYNMDPARIVSAITAKTRGIVPVHLYGQPSDMDAIMEIASDHSLWVVEDSCQAHLAEYKGRRTGSMGMAAAFSFYPGKNLGACGEGGAVTTNNVEMADKIRMLRDHGQAKKYFHEAEGYNGRCDAVQAAALTVKLKYLQAWNETRRKLARRYFERLGDVDKIVLPKVSEGCLPVYHLFVILVDKRDEVAAALGQKGISTGLHYPVPLHLQRAYSAMGMLRGSFPVAEECAEKLLSLPMSPELTENHIDYVCEHLRVAVENVLG